MRKILYIALLSVLAVSAKAQIPINTFFDVSTPNPIDGRFVIPTLSDTSTITDLYDGLLTVVQDTDQLWQHDGVKWVQFETGTSDNIYNTNGTITGNRTVTVGAGNSLNITTNDGDGQIYIEDGVGLQLGGNTSTPGGRETVNFPEVGGGLQYGANYSTKAGFGDRTIPDWGYVSEHTVAPAISVNHNTTLTFQNSKYYQPFTVTADTLTYTADTTSGVFGSYTVARVGFGDPGKPVIFDGTVFDTVQTYNIASGDTLSGVHMLYFEHTPYGVAVSVPTNNRSGVDTLEGGGSSSDPALTKSGGLALYTGLEGLTQVNDTLVQWVDQINQDTARNRLASFEPAITGLGVNFNGDNHLEMITGFQFQDNIAITAAFNVTGIPGPQNSIFGEETDAGTLDFNYNRFDGGFTAFRDANVTTPLDTISQNDMVVLQVSCASGSCEFWKNGVSIGSDTFTETLPKTYIILGALNNTGSSTLRGTLYYLSVHRATYTSAEITDFFNYVNTQFSMGL